MSNEFEKEPTKPAPFREIPGGGDLPVTTNFTYQPGATSEPDENTTSVTIDFEAKPGVEGWTWEAWAANADAAIRGGTTVIVASERAFTTPTSLVKLPACDYFGVFVKCTRGSATETEGVLYQWSNGQQHGTWTVSVINNGNDMQQSN